MADSDFSRAEVKVKRGAEGAEGSGRSALLDALNARAAAGGHGVDLGNMPPEDIRSRLFGD